jgi:hypothetical protein
MCVEKIVWRFIGTVQLQAHGNKDLYTNTQKICIYVQQIDTKRMYRTDFKVLQQGNSCVAAHSGQSIEPRSQ